WEAIDAETDEIESARMDAYRTVLDALLADYPDDVESWLARGNAEEYDPDGKGQSGYESTIPYYSEALKLDPNHPGAHHYLTHTYENLRRYEEAVEHASIYAKLAHGAPHAQHMYGHVLPRVGEWDQAVVQFEKAAAVEQAYYENESIPPHMDWHHIHNLTLLGWAYERVGRMEDAKRTLREAFELPVDGWFRGAFDHVNYVNLLVLMGATDEATEAAQRLIETGGNAGKTMGFSLMGQANLGAGNDDAAQSALEQAESALAALKEETAGTVREWAIDETATYVETLRALLNAHSDDPMLQYVGQKSLRDLTESMTSGSSFDGWGEGYLRVAGILASLKQAGLTSFADELRALRDENPQ
ncbi:MAG: hypothetical protein O3A46_16685, partial [Candidatus Poribacteria bacterium]|nr:hypothetical protein [Candidatus Poribacteria bacterium]